MLRIRAPPPTINQHTVEQLIAGIIKTLTLDPNKCVNLLMRNCRHGILLMDRNMGGISEYSRHNKPPERTRQCRICM